MFNILSGMKPEIEDVQCLKCQRNSQVCPSSLRDPLSGQKQLNLPLSDPNAGEGRHMWEQPPLLTPQTFVPVISKSS